MIEGQTPSGDAAQGYRVAGTNPGACSQVALHKEPEIQATDTSP